MATNTPMQRNIGRDMLLAVTILVTGLNTDVFTASVVGSVGALVLVAWNYYDMRRIDWVMLGAGLVGIGFALLALYLNDKSFVKFRPTFSSAVMALVSLVLISIRQSPSQRLFGAIYDMQAKHWRTLDLLTVAYTLLRGGLNYFVATQFSDDTWLWYSTVVSKGIGMAYTVAIMAFLVKYKLREHSISEMSFNPFSRQKRS